MARDIDANALRFNRLLASTSVGNRTVGLVPDAHITQWIYDATGGGQPSNAPRGEMKVPAVWNLAYRRGSCSDTSCDVGLFADGYATGRGWIGGAVLGAGQDLPVVASAEYQAEVRTAEDAVTSLAPPPPFPCKVDENLVAEGKRVFEEKQCARCHEMDPAKPPRMVPFSRIRTDPLRLTLLGHPPGSDGVYGAETRRRMDLITDSVPRLARALYKDLDAGGVAPHGYLAPKLDGIWARFPYLHNGSVPSLDALFSAPEDRPAQFDLTLVETRGCYDPEVGGLRDSDECKPNLRLWRGQQDPEQFEPRTQFRNVYDTRRSGHGNGGHDFWRKAGTDEWLLKAPERRALIEYLNTLGGTAYDSTWCPPPNAGL
jgi:hypothetical protein